MPSKRQLKLLFLLVWFPILTVHLAADSLITPTWEQVNTSGFGSAQILEVSAIQAFGAYLYAGTYNPLDPGNQLDGAQIFRSANGETWDAVTDPGFGSDHDNAPPAILDFASYNGYLYAGTGRGNASQLWRSQNGTIWAPVDVTGFGDPDNVEVSILGAYNGQLYAAVANEVTGVQIWRSFSGNNNTWTKVTSPVSGTGFAKVTGMAEFNGGLFVAVESEAPAQIWSTFGGDWTVDVDDGFGDPKTTMTGGLVVFNEHLFAGAGNSESGPQLWRSADGEIWELALTPSTANADNEKIEMLTVFQGQLYAGIKNSVTGLEVWRTVNGMVWERANGNGFGDSNNSTTNASNAAALFADQLYLGTSNDVDGGEIWRMQTEYGVDLSSDQAKEGIAGTEVSYEMTVTNVGQVADTYDLSMSGNLWSTTLSVSEVAVAASQSQSFTVTVTIPPDAAAQQQDTVSVQATSRGNAQVSDQATLATSSIVQTLYDVALSENASLEGPAGGEVIYILMIRNTGNMADTYDITMTENSWPTFLSSSSFEIAAGESQEFQATVHIPSAATASVSDDVVIRATSLTLPTVSDSAVLTTLSTGYAATVYLPCVVWIRMP